MHSRTEALKFIIHLMGDIHMPLHLGFKKDFGGNALFIGYNSYINNIYIKKYNINLKSLHEF